MPNGQRRHDAADHPLEKQHRHEPRAAVSEYRYQNGELTERLKALPEDKLETELKRLLSRQYDPGDLGFPDDEAEMARNLGWG